MNTGDELPDDIWNALIAAGERHDYGAGAWIFVEDDPAGPAFAVIEGMVRVEAARERIPLEVGSFGPGSLFGELAAIDGHPRSASAIATEPTKVAAIDAPTLNRLLTEHSSFTLAMLRLLAARLRATTTFAVEHMPQDLDRRLAATLCELAPDPRHTRGHDRDGRRDAGRALDAAASRSRNDRRSDQASARTRPCGPRSSLAARDQHALARGLVEIGSVTTVAS